MSTPTVTMSPNPVLFGEVTASSSATSTATLTFSAALTADVTLSIPAPFAVSPTTVTAGETSVLITLTYTAPAADSVDNELLSVTGGATASFAVSAAVATESGMTTAEKYLLLQVPDYGETTYEVAAHKSLEAPGFNPQVLTSFLRLGKFDMEDEPPAAKYLLGLIAQVNCATDPRHWDGADPPNSLEGDSTYYTKGTEKMKGVVFADDIRDRPQDWDNVVSSTTVPTTPAIAAVHDPAHGLTKTKRQQESAKLYSRGGWRDHSDGNRISTTFGDKVEVVRGNYKMIVMGRQDDPGESHGWEAGGSHIQDFAAGTMPGASLWLEWINDYRFQRPKLDTKKPKIKSLTFDNKENWIYQTEKDKKGNVVMDQMGVWLLVNTTENVYEYARNAGNFREEVWGDVNETYVGSENPPPDGIAYARNDEEGTEGHTPPATLDDRNYHYPSAQSSNTGRSAPPWTKDTAGVIRSNPHIIEKTWAARIDSHTGSAKCPVPEIHDKTWADKVYEETHLGIGKNIYEKRADSYTYINGWTLENTIILGAPIGSLTFTTTTGLALDVTSVGGVNIECTNVVGAHIETYVALGAHLSIDLSPAFVLDFSASAYKVDCSVGKVFTVTAISETECNPKAEELDIAKDEIYAKLNQLAMDTTCLAAATTKLSQMNKIISQTTMDMAMAHMFL